MEYKICSGWHILTSIKIVLGHFSLALTIIEIFRFQNVWSWKWWSRLWCTTFAVTPFNGKYITSYLIAIVMFALSHTIYVIFANQRKCQLWPWKWRPRSRRRKMGLEPFSWKCPIIYRSFFSEIFLSRNKRLCKTIHTNIQSARQRYWL